MKQLIIKYLIAFCTAFSFPALMIYGGSDFETNKMLYSPHGGMGGLLSVLCFPWIVFVFTRYIIKAKGEQRRNNILLAILSIVFYSLSTIPLTTRVQHNLYFNFGLAYDDMNFWNAINFPLSLLVNLFISAG